MLFHQGPMHVNIPLEEPLYDFNDQKDLVVEQVKQPKNLKTKKS